MSATKKKKVGGGSTYGMGSVTQLPNGRWRVRLVLPDKRRVGGVCETEADAKELRKALAEERPAGDLGHALALEVLRGGEVMGEAFTLAVAVLEGGPLRIRRAVDLAACVFTAADSCAREGTG